MKTALFLKPRAHAIRNNQLPLAEAGLFPLLRDHGRICSGHRPGILRCERTYMETNLEKVKESAIWGLTKSHQIPFTTTPYAPHSYTLYWTGTSLQMRLMRGSLFKSKWHKSLFNDTPSHEPPLQASSSLIPRIPIWHPSGTLFPIGFPLSYYISITFSEESITCIVREFTSVFK